MTLGDSKKNGAVGGLAMAEETNTENIVTSSNPAYPPSRLRGLKLFKKGQSGNPGGRPKRDLAAEIAKRIFEENEEAIYQALRKALLKGNVQMFKELADRAFGKVRERMELAGADGEPVQTEIRITMVKPHTDAELGLEELPPNPQSAQEQTSQAATGPVGQPKIAAPRVAPAIVPPPAAGLFTCGCGARVNGAGQLCPRCLAGGDRDAAPRVKLAPAYSH